MSQGYATTISAVQFTGCTINPAQIANANAWIGTDSAATLGITYNVPTSTTNGHQFTVNGALGFQVGKTGAATASVFMAASQSTAGLLINGAASITGNIFECDLTSGGTAATWVDKNGVLNFGNLGGSSIPNGPAITGGLSGALLLNAKASQPVVISAGSSAATTLATFTSSSATIPVAQVIAGGGNINTSAGTSGVYQAGSANAATIAMVYGNTAGSARYTLIGSIGDTVQTVPGTQFEVKDSSNGALITVDNSGNLGVSGTVHQSSKRALKQRIEYIDPAEALDVVLRTKIARFDWKDEELLQSGKLRHASFIADETPWQLSGGDGREYADAQKTASYVLAALQAVHAEFQELKSKLPAS